MRRTLLKVLGLSTLCVGAALLLLTAVLRRRDPVPDFPERRGRVASVTLDSATRDGTHVIQAAHLQSTSGVAFDMLIKRPVTDVAGPLVLILGGHATGREAARLIPDTRGRVVVALSYPYNGPHRMSGLDVLRWAPTIRQALLDTPPAIMLALDWLVEQPWVDAREIHGVGASLGTPFMTVAASLDNRVTHLWSVHGAGNSRAMLTHNARESVPDLLAPLAGALADVLVAGPYLTPERWIGRVSPRPFLMLNATEDERLPRHTIQTLYDSAKTPKQLIWMPGKHVQRNRPEVVQALVNTVLDCMERVCL